MRSSFDGDLRRLERAHRALPDDAATAHRYMLALKRAGREEPALTLQFRLGERVEACAALSIRWMASEEQLRGICRGGEALSAEVARALVADDLEHFDPVRLAKAWPRRKDGAYRLNTTRYLKRYRAHEAEAPHQRLTLIAWTPGTQSLYLLGRRTEQGKREIVVGLETRATRTALLPPSLWRS